MGSVEYMCLIRQRGSAFGTADQTDQGEHQEDSESDMDDDMEIEPTIPTTAARPQNLTGMVEFLKDDQRRCSQNGELWDSNAIQNLVLECLERCQRWHVSQQNFQTFQRFEENCRRWKSATRYGRISENYAGCIAKKSTNVLFLWKTVRGLINAVSYGKQRRKMWMGH